MTLGEMHGGLDFAAAVKLTGSRFVVMKGSWPVCTVRWRSSCWICIPNSTATSENYVPAYVVNRDTLYGASVSCRNLPAICFIPSAGRKADSSNYALIPCGSTADQPRSR